MLCFKKKENETLEDILSKLKSELFAYSYEKIWEEMTEMDRFLAGLLTEKEEYKRDEILKLMGEKAGSYSMYRDRLIKRGILNNRDMSHLRCRILQIISRNTADKTRNK